MQISYVGQYNKNAGQAVGTPVPTTAVSSLTASIKELAPGSIFEGNVSYVKGANVISVWKTDRMSMPDWTVMRQSLFRGNLCFFR